MSFDQHESALELRNVHKAFPGVIALHDVSFTLRPGEIHALLGENGAGKSTLIKILAGIHAPDRGELLVRDRPASLRTPKDAQILGISLVPQDVVVVRELSIGRNILLGLESPMAGPGRLSQAERRKIDYTLQKVGATFDAETPAKALSVPELRLAQIARALIQSSEIMVLDEPTAVLSEPDALHLQDRLKQFRDEGRAILYVTHRLSEVMRMADRLTILRDGGCVGVFSRGELKREDIVRFMARDAPKPKPVSAPKVPHRRALQPRLRVRGLTAGSRFQAVDLDAFAGSIVGVAGVQGSGHGALLRAIGGLDPVESGSVALDGEEQARGVESAVRSGILTVPADRRGAAVIPALSLRSNLAISRRIRKSARRWGLRWNREELRMTHSHIASFGIRPPIPESILAHFSGGNQQKVALARAVEGQSSVLLIEEPTQGVDVSAKAEIHDLLRRLASEKGCAVVVATSEFEELIGLADDIHVMRMGRIVKHISGSGATYREILESALS